MAQESYESAIWKPSEMSDFLPREQRRSCSFFVGITVDGHDGHGMIHNLSLGGAGLKTDPILRLHAGQRLQITSKELGHLTATIRWAVHPNYGLQFEISASQRPRIREVYDSLAPAGGT